MSSNHESSISITIDKASCHFSASHALISVNYAEGFHGHNYFVEVGVRGLVDNDELLLDFIYLENLLQKIASEWDHYVLVPSSNLYIKIKESNNNLVMEYFDRLYSIPKSEVKIISCSNVTTEALARIFGEKLVSCFKNEDFWPRIKGIKVTIWETISFHATYEIDLAD
ncbi:6-pyruvoyl trahydropterin synthase family protein [Candidatus Hodarchaeum mangrovi]